VKKIILTRMKLKNRNNISFAIGATNLAIEGGTNYE